MALCMLDICMEMSCHELACFGIMTRFAFSDISFMPELARVACLE